MAGSRAQKNPVAKHPPFALVTGLFVFSGAAGLVDQVCFSKYLSYIVGSTAYAVSAVLAAFMCGLALGAHLGGRFAARVKRPLLAYGVLELVVGGGVALAPPAFAALTPAYVALVQSAPDSLLAVSAFRWGLAMLIVIVPTTAMGATLPLLSGLVRAPTSDGASPSGELASGTDAAPPARERERRLGKLYAANTLGGAFGSLGAAYFLLAALGLPGSVWAAALASVAVGVVAISVGRHATVELDTDKSVGREGDETSEESPKDSSLRPALLFLLAFASGALVFSCEVIFTHLLALVVGNSVFAFGVVLAVFLICLFFGASLAPRLHTRFGSAALPIGLAATAAALTLTLPAWDQLPLAFGPLGPVVTSFAGRELVRGLMSLSILALPTVLMGLTFPLLLQRIAAGRDVAKWVGRLTAVNTLGAVVGALSTGYLVLPRLGSEWSIIAVAMVFAMLTLTCVRGIRPLHRMTSQVAVAGAAVAALAVPRWDLARLTAGANVYFTGYHPPAQVLFVREDVLGGVTTVTENEGVRTLYTNGKFQGNNGWELHAQRFFAHYPCLFVDRFGRALVIGLGTGTTLGTLEAYPWERIDVVEISPAIAVAAGEFFTEPNRHALSDERVRLRFEDGRNHLLVSTERYDLIGMELSSIWFAGASSLYSREYYRLVAEHLREGGIFQQWVQLHHLYTRDFATVLNTLRQEFEHVALFYGGGQGILVASDQPLATSRARLGELGMRPGVRATLNGRQLEHLVHDVLLPPEALDRFLDDVASREGTTRAALVSTDENLYLEYATPRGNVLPWSSKENLEKELRKYRSAVEVEALFGAGD